MLKSNNEFIPKFERAQSHLDPPNAEGELILLFGKPLEKGQFGYELHPRIYPSGLVMLNPRWTSETYDLFYSRYYDELYRLDYKADYGKAGIINHMKQIWERIKSSFENKKNVRILDAGSGPGYGLKWLKQEMPNIKLHGIEASADACRILQDEVGAKLIDTDIDGEWTDRFEGYFDLIIMRHVVEHLVNPVDTLYKLANTLSSGGMIYIAVPDMMHPRTILRDYDLWWEYWFRPVHPYYYSKDTLFATLSMTGFYPILYGEDNEEVWCLVCSDKKFQHVPYNAEELYDKQNQLLNKLLC